jgi:hypothetical protein
MTYRIHALFLSLLLLKTSDAADYVVGTNSDSGPGSLRQAILDANAGGGGTITFSNVNGIIDLISGLPILTANITISGPGASELALTNSNRRIDSILTNSAASTGAITGITICGTLDNYGTLVMVGSLVGNQFNPGYSAIMNSGTMTLSRCIFTGNGVPDGADSIMNNGTMNLDYCTVTNNRSDWASIVNYGSLTMDNSVVSGHGWFTSSAGGLYNAGGIMVLRNCSISGNSSVEGGGIWNGGSLAATNCLISYNSAHYSEWGERGGGVFNIGYAVLQNTTVSGNYAQGEGGGIWNRGGLRLLNCTITSNTIFMYQQLGAGGGVWNLKSDYAIFQSRNSIIAGNSSFTYTNGGVLTSPNDISGYFESLGHNLILGTNGWTKVGYNNTDLLGVDPMLGPLQDNGGPTWTHALLPGSPAIDAGDPTGAPADDQRGVPRPQGPGIDIGAFEYQYPPPTFASIQVQSNTNLVFTAYAFPSTVYTLQASQDFIFWDNIATLTSSSNGVLRFSTPITCPKCFYRLQSTKSSPATQARATLANRP